MSYPKVGVRKVSDYGYSVNIIPSDGADPLDHQMEVEDKQNADGLYALAFPLPDGKRVVVCLRRSGKDTVFSTTIDGENSPYVAVATD